VEETLHFYNDQTSLEHLEEAELSPFSSMWVFKYQYSDHITL
jgi:hypothetical protein